MVVLPSIAAFEGEAAHAQRKSEGLRAFAQSLSTAGLGGITLRWISSMA